MNTAYGDIKDLPFDLQTRRIMTYNLSEGSTDKPSQRDSLVRRLKDALVSILEMQSSLDNAPVPLWQRTKETIEQNANNQKSLLHQYLSSVVDELDKLNPDFANAPANELDNLLVAAIDNTQELLLQFTSVVDAVALSGGSELASQTYNVFETILQRYDLQRGFNGQFSRIQFDFYKFIGHELFVTFIALLLKHKQWGIIAELLDIHLYKENGAGGSAEMVSYSHLSQYIGLLEHRKHSLRLNRISLHSDILYARHKSDEVSKLLPASDFIEADYLLFFRSVLCNHDQDGRLIWSPWSALYIGSNPPRFLLSAVYQRFAKQLLDVFKVENIEALRLMCVERKPKLSGMFGAEGMYWVQDPLNTFDMHQIGTR